jgi:serine/threonine protein kinase
VGSEFSLEPFHDHYSLVNIIARGQFSEIWECLHCSTQQSYVAKLIPLSSGEHAHHELKMLTRLSHTNTVCVSATYQTDKNYIFLFQLLRGLNLFEHVTVTEQLSEPLAAYFMEQLLSALEYLHNLHIAHLAIKVLIIMHTHWITVCLTCMFCSVHNSAILVVTSYPGSLLLCKVSRIDLAYVHDINSINSAKGTCTKRQLECSLSFPGSAFNPRTEGGGSRVVRGRESLRTEAII